MGLPRLVVRGLVGAYVRIRAGCILSIYLNLSEHPT